MGKVSNVVYPELQTTQKLLWTGENFLIWKLKFAFVLTDHGFPHLVDPSPADPTWNDENRDARLLILQSLDNNLGREFCKNQSPASIMGALLTRFNSLLKDFTGIYVRRYKKCRMAPGTHINRHIFRMRAIAKELELGAGVKIPDDVQAMFLLNSLPEDWAEDVERLLRDLDGWEEDLSFVNFSRKLRVLQDVSALKTHGSKKKQMIIDSCSRCGKQGHYQSNCPDPGSSKEENFVVSLDIPKSKATLSEIIYPNLKTRFRIDYKGTDFFSLWRREISDVLEDNEVDYVLKGPEPSDSTSEEDADRFKKWRADDFTCRHLILGTMEDDVFLSFYDFPTAKSLMDAIEAFFNSASVAQKLVQLRRYMNYRMAEETPIIHHLVDMNVMASDLIDSGMCIPSKMQSVFLIDSLPVSWNETVTSLEVNLGADKENGWDIDNVWQMVKDFGQFKQYLKENRKNDSRIHDNAGGNTKNKRILRGNCYSCGRTGHYQSDCPDRR